MSGQWFSLFSWRRLPEENFIQTSKQLCMQIRSTDHLMMKIETEHAHLSQVMPISTSAVGRNFIRQHRFARLNLPIESRCQVLLRIPPQTHSQRLFQGFLACLTGHEPGGSTEPSTLHVWDIRNPDPTRQPRKVLTISKPKLFDVVIDLGNNLLVLLLYWAG